MERDSFVASGRSLDSLSSPPPAIGCDCSGPRTLITKICALSGAQKPRHDVLGKRRRLPCRTRFGPACSAVGRDHRRRLQAVETDQRYAQYARIEGGFVQSRQSAWNSALRRRQSWPLRQDSCNPADSAWAAARAPQPGRESMPRPRKPTPLIPPVRHPSRGNPASSREDSSAETSGLCSIAFRDWARLAAFSRSRRIR